MKKNDSAEISSDREIVTSRVYDAPRELVFKAFTDPEQVVKWWGPRGFTTTTFSMDVRPGGMWRFVMHGPDGVDYQNKIVYVEVVEHERLVYNHSGGDDELVDFQTTITFTARGQKTEVTMRAVFVSVAACQHAVEKYGAVEGAIQHLEHLGEHVAKIVAGKKDMDDDLFDGYFVISRVYDAPRDLVFKSWTENERLQQWWGPKGCEIPACTMDLRPGGIFHYGMRLHNGDTMWGKWTFREIIVPERLVFIVSFSDEAGGLARHPYAPNWPLETLSIVTFSEHAGKTAVTMRWTALNPTDVEQKTFNAGYKGMRQGCFGTLEQLAEYLAKA